MADKEARKRAIKQASELVRGPSPWINRAGPPLALTPYSPPSPPTRSHTMPGAKINVTPPEPKITVSIPVKIGGYTGQYDKWEEHEGEYAVSVVGDSVELSDRSGIPGREISFSRRALEKALQIVGGEQPVLRRGDPFEAAARAALDIDR